MWTKKDIPQSDGSIFPYGIVAWSWNHLYIMGVVSGAVFDLERAWLGRKLESCQAL